MATSGTVLLSWIVLRRVFRPTVPSSGWRDIEAQQSEVSVNQLVQSDGEDASIARTDADFSSRIWQAWDDDGLWVVTAAADNVHDVEGGDRGWAWWERDSLSLYVDLLNEKEESVLNGEYTALNIVNFQARPLESKPLHRFLGPYGRECSFRRGR